MMIRLVSVLLITVAVSGCSDDAATQSGQSSPSIAPDQSEAMPANIANENIRQLRLVRPQEREGYTWWIDGHYEEAHLLGYRETLLGNISIPSSSGAFNVHNVAHIECADGRTILALLADQVDTSIVLVFGAAPDGRAGTSVTTPVGQDQTEAWLMRHPEPLELDDSQVHEYARVLNKQVRDDDEHIFPLKGRVHCEWDAEGMIQTARVTAETLEPLPIFREHIERWATFYDKAAERQEARGNVEKAAEYRGNAESWRSSLQHGAKDAATIEFDVKARWLKRTWLWDITWP